MSSIDELPQLLNVLRGEMSLIGPRMITPAELPKYGPKAIDCSRFVPACRACGKCRGGRKLTPDRVRMDLDYIEHWGFGRDLTIALRTPAAVLRARGAH